MDIIFIASLTIKYVLRSYLMPSRQREYQILHPEKQEEIHKRYRLSTQGKQAIKERSHNYYIKNQEYRNQWNKQNRIKKLLN